MKHSMLADTRMMLAQLAMRELLKKTIVNPLDENSNCQETIGILAITAFDVADAMIEEYDRRDVPVGVKS